MKTTTSFINLISLIIFTLLGSMGFAQQSEVYGNIGAKPSPNFSDYGPLLWSQMDVPGTSFLISQEVTNVENETETSFLADDFFVPDGESWDIGTIGLVTRRKTLMDIP